MDSQRYLRCLGQPVLFAANGEAIRFRTRKHLALLVYLAVEPRSHRRDRLAELFWPKVSATEARHSLATALSILRPRLGLDGLETSRDHARLTPRRVTLDLERLQSGDVLGSEVRGPLEVSAFLDGFDITDSAEFTHWKDSQQARLLPVIKDALLVLIDRCRRTGDTRQIEQLADRMLALDDLSEEAIRAKMEARAFAGDRLTALEIFEAWKKKLAQELQAAPSDLVEGMAVRLRRRGWERTTLANIPNVPTDQWRGRPFIGRTAEYRALYELWEGVRKGVPGHALILGDSGVGKTTLVQRLTTAAGLEGAAISRVQCYDLEREIPYSTLSSLVLGLLDRPGVSATSPEALAELSRTIPAVRHRFPNIPLPSESQGETARIRLTEAFLQMLTAIAEEHPVVLVLDDLHLADDVSLAVLHLIIRRVRGLPIVVLMIARPGELAQASQASRLRESAAPLGIREIELSPLSSDESRDMLHSLVRPDEPQPGVTEERALLRAAAGYPMVLELLVQDWKVSRQHSLALGIDAMTAELGNEGSAQSAYRQILDRITRSLDSTTHNVLNLASILGSRLNDVAMYAIVDLSAGQTMTAMAELVDRRVLRDGAQGLEFVNELVRTAAYVGVPLTLRRILHGNIADWFIRENTCGTSDLGLEIAWHCIRAGRNNEATPYLLRGARDSIYSGVPYAAERGLSTAMPHLRDKDKSEAVLLLAESLQEQGRNEESLTALDQLDLQQWSSLSDGAFVLKAKAQRRLGYFASIYPADIVDELMTIVRSAGDTPSRLTAAVEIASILNGSHSHTVTRLVLERLSSIELEALGTEDKARLFLAKSMLTYNIKDYNSSQQCIRQATELLEHRHGSSSVLAMLQNGTGAILAAQGRYAESVPELLCSYHSAAGIGNDKIYQQAAGNLALCFVRLGDYEQALQWADRCLHTLENNTPRSLQFSAIKSEALAYAMLGRRTKAEELIRRRTEELAIVKSPGLSQAWALYSADSYAMLGQIRAAEEVGRYATEGPNGEMHMDSCAGSYARWIARSSHLAGKIKRGHETLECLLSSLGRYDALDQAEILNAQSWLEAQEGRVSSPRLKQMQDHLSKLPAAVEDQLKRMGMLDFY